MAITEKKSDDLFEDGPEGTVELFAYGQRNLDVGKPTRPLSIILPLLTLILIIVIVSILSLFFYQKSKAILLEKEIEELDHVNNIIRPLIRQFYASKQQDILSLSNQISLEALEFNNTNDLSRIFNEKIKRNPYYQLISLVDNQGTPIYGIEKKQSLINAGTSEINNTRFLPSPFLSQVFTYSAGDTYFSPLFSESNDNSSSLYSYLAVRLLDPKSVSSAYALVIKLDMHAFFNDVIIKNNEEIDFLLVDQQGKYLFNIGSLASFSGESLFVDAPSLKQAIDNNIPELALYPHHYPGIELPTYYSLVNLSQFGADYALRMLLVYKDHDHVHDLVLIGRQFIAVGVIFALLSFLITWALTNRLIRPLRRMTESIRSYEKLGAIESLPIESNDEVGVLARSFHNLLKNKEEREVELIKTKNYIDGITNEAPVLLAYVDKYQTYQFVNRRYELWSGKKAENIVGLCIADLLNKENYETVKPYIKRALNGEMVAFYADINYKQNNLRHVHLTYTPQKDTCNNVLGFYVCVEDITESTLDKNRIKDLRQRLDFALEAPGIGVWDYDVLTGEVYWDERMYPIYNTFEKEFLHTYADWVSRIHVDDKQRVEEKFKATLERGEEFVDEFRILWQNGEVRWVIMHGRATINQEKIARIVGTNMDITSKKKLELDKEIALAKAEESAQLKSAFLASMSHEIRTPMNGVLGMLGLLKATELDKKQHHYLSLANSSADSLLTLINDILDFSKVEAGKIELDIIDFHLPDMLGDFAESLAHRAQEKGLELILDITGISENFVKGDPGRLRQILTNLTANSIKFTEQGEITIAVQLHKNRSGKLQLEGVISDTGIGIPEDKIDTLFDSFSQVDASTTRKYGGTGLGLAIVKQLCELMDGDISVVSSLGVGSQFMFNVELHESERSELFVPKVNISGTPILIVDHNQTSLEVLSQQLRNWGADTYECARAQDALDLLCAEKETCFKVAIIDKQLIDMDGETLAKTIRKHEEFNDLKLIMMTSISCRGDAKRFADAGFSAFFPKPATANDLFDALNVLLDEGDALAQAHPLLTRHHLKQLDGREWLPEGEKLLSDYISTDEVTVKSEDIDSTPETEAKVHHPKKLHILMVEDNVINQEVAKGILQAFGLRPDIANHGIEALEMLNNNQDEAPYDLILMDCQMPEMDGYETTRAIRAGKVPNPNIPIIAMTANAMKGDKEKCLSVGMNDYLSKPIDPDELSATLSRWMRAENTTAHTNNEGNTMSQAEQPVWDRDDFMRRIMNNETIANKLINLFKTDTPKTIQQLAEAIQSNQVEEAGRIAHKLKGSVSNLGGIKLASLAQQIEQAGKSANIDEVKALWPNVQPQFECLVEQIEQRI